MTALYLVAGFVWVLVFVLRRRRSARRSDVLVGAGSTRDVRSHGGGF